MYQTAPAVNREEIVAIRSACDVGFRPLSWKGTTLYPVEVYLSDGRIRVQFQQDMAHCPYSDASAPRVSYNFASRGRRGVRIAGLLVPPQLRDGGLGGKILDWLVTGMDETETPVVGTHRINKPMTALLLTRFGFVPESDCSIAEIVDAGDGGAVPSIKWIHNVRGTNTTIEGSPAYGPFYRVIGAASVEGYEQPNNPSRVVCLHSVFNRKQ
jgi:hypothetical protein